MWLILFLEELGPTLQEFRIKSSNLLPPGEPLSIFYNFFDSIQRIFLAYLGRYENRTGGETAFQ